MELISPIDAVFLLAESREHPMHVGSLQLFEAPEDAGPDFAQLTYEKLSADREFHPTFRKRPATWLGAPQVGWTQEGDVELEYHLRRAALPAPGRFDQLLDLASRLHSTLLDRHRPLWEIHLVEGLGDGRFAIYSKMHHALIDGVAAQRVLARTLTNDPNSAETRVPWHLPRSTRPPKAAAAGSGLGNAARNLLSAAGSAPAAVRVARAALVEQQLTLPFDAPRSMFNVPIGGARRCAVRSWPLERVKQVKKATGSTINDVVLTMSAGALRSYLIERNALPDKPLIAMVPMSLRASDEDEDTNGNKIGAILCNLATDVEDPIERLRVVSESMRRSKEVYNSLSSVQAMALSAVLLSPLALTLLPGVVSWTNPPFNIVISNVPGAREPQYWNGARLDATYPMSIPMDGQAVNITLTTNADNLDFGLVGCRRSVPQLDRLLDHLEDALTGLEQAAR
ncbi:WS/DGAT/MGAT family O-acyltransferase [Nocardia sp. NBC_01009]|uniref:WS/DGAT/MGAT family O-acyltransferase n=1 Tax=Nocardia sp. NBC_01009 TaxID=2975996 RepID=UPI00386B55CA|nr:wax ester/triacylglycerol synthase family O-acyltransferase [Nocardia sp. NBC_01009]